MGEHKKTLLLGGTEEAVRLNAKLSKQVGIALVTSLAGRTVHPASLSGSVVTGGFGGAAGLSRFIVENDIELVIDASHPFAEQITQTAFDVCGKQQIPFLRYHRPAWDEQAGDRWISARSVEEAAQKLDGFTRIFFTIGRQELAPFEKLSGKFFLVRSIEKTDFRPLESDVNFVQARGPFNVDEEIRLLKEHDVDLLIAKNSGGSATYAKIEAARELHIPVLMIERPPLPDCPVFSDIEALLAAAGF